MRRWILVLALTGAAAAVTGCGPGYPHCERQDDCHEGEHCVMQRCQQCRHANDCAASQRCVQGRCE
ncbi:MAG TPA: hypothetical protein RMH99_23015 [Sandaracinaceae bacterium LLY-WYZ-13_1]|nr:hypothetical protein [Sandaracinaceae bacterium LLY-WYZ-13_1]